MVYSLDVCDRLNECDANVDDCEGDYTGEVTGVTLLRDDVTKVRTEEKAWYDKCEAHEKVTDKTCVSRTGRKRISCRCRDINKGDSGHVEVRNRVVACEIKQKNN